MNKNYSQHFSDEELDRLARAVLQSHTLTAEEVDEIAASPRLRWQVQSRLAAEKSRRKSWQSLVWHWRTVMGAMLIVFGAMTTMWLLSASPTEIAAVPKLTNNEILEEKVVSLKGQSESPKSISKPSEPEKANRSAARQNNSILKAKKVLLKSVPPQPAFHPETAARRIIKSKSVQTAQTEFVTEYIALSYSTAAESGQVVRVKVPRSMLVSLGVLANVERGKELINAEVVVGDDGAARAIRFFNR